MRSLKVYGPLIILVLLIDTIAELIGMQVFKIGKIEVSILPLVFAVILLKLPTYKSGLVP